MKANRKVIISFTILVVLIFGLYFFTDWFSKVTGYLFGEDERAKLVECLNRNGAEVYISSDCSECEEQIRVFREHFDKLFIVECGVSKTLCNNLREVPAWYINSEIYYGLKDMNELKEISGCK